MDFRGRTYDSIQYVNSTGQIDEDKHNKSFKTEINGIIKMNSDQREFSSLCNYLFDTQTLRSTPIFIILGENQLSDLSYIKKKSNTLKYQKLFFMKRFLILFLNFKFYFHKQ